MVSSVTDVMSIRVELSDSDSKFTFQAVRNNIVQVELLVLAVDAYARIIGKLVCFFKNCRVLDVKRKKRILLGLSETNITSPYWV